MSPRKQICNGMRPAALALVLSIATAAHAQDEAPTVLSETYQNWMVTCRNVAVDNQVRRHCQMTQELRQQGPNGRRLLALVIAPHGDQYQLTAVTPLGTALAAGVALVVGDDTVAQMAYTTCRQAGCVAQAGLSGKIASALRGGMEATARMKAMEGQPVTVKFPLAGFGAALARLAELVRG
jgi:invasion protein IalB